MSRSLICWLSVLLASLWPCYAHLLEILGHSKVSRNGGNTGNERSLQSYSLKKLRTGEIYDFSKYSTLDREMVAKMDAKAQHQAQDRFHPPASFEHVLAHENAVKTPASTSVTSAGAGLQQIYDKYEFGPGPGPRPTSDPLPSITIDYSPDTYAKGPEKVPGYLEFPVEHGEHDDFGLHEHELIYEHPPDFYHHDYLTKTTTTTTMEPEMNDQRLSKKPYSYYYIGKKLWYLPLYFSIYFVIYIAALVLKSIARHKINFPASLAHAGERNFHESTWWDWAERVFQSVEQFKLDSTFIRHLQR